MHCENFNVAESKIVIMRGFDPASELTAAIPYGLLQPTAVQL